MAKQGWPGDWNVGVRVWLDRRGQTVLGEGRADLLEAIGKHKSITAAAKAVGMSYRRAWTLIQEVNEAAGEPLVESAVGGVQGGGASLTDRGRAAVEIYRQLHGSLERSAAATLGAILQTAAPQPCLHLAAAISLQEAVGQILPAFMLHRPLARVRTLFGASNELADQLLGGAPGDVFISADATDADRLEVAGRIAADSRRIVARNGLAGICPVGSHEIAKLADFAGKKVGRVALADPACPLGRLSQRYLESQGVAEAIRAKAVFVDNSRAVLSAIVAEAADAGLAFASDAESSEECEVAFNIPSRLAATEYVAAALKGSERLDEALELLDFLGSARAAQSFRRCGLRAPAKKRG